MIRAQEILLAGMYRNVVRYVMHCRECQRRNPFLNDHRGRLVPIPPAIAPFHRIDLPGEISPKSASWLNKWIIVCTDYPTRYAITKALPTAEVAEIAKFLLEEACPGTWSSSSNYHRSWSRLSIQTCFLSSTPVTLIIVSQRRIIPKQME
ncbi:transposon Ty3-I Gag-Pol polyprotein [Trichonephila clavipes]|nr:transposon Ty3-I Gag-Pol polyprotein [Trichonephila clavipes]